MFCYVVPSVTHAKSLNSILMLVKRYYFVFRIVPQYALDAIAPSLGYMHKKELTPY